MTAIHLHRFVVALCLVALVAPCSACDDTQPQPEPEAVAPSPTPEAAPSARELSERYDAIKKRLASGARFPVGEGDEAFAQVEGELREIADKAESPTLRANASLMLASIYEERGEMESAIAFYRQARALAPEDPSATAVLALALHASGDHAAAVELQKELIEAVPDDLEAWLLLGEMSMKAGDEEGGKKAYAGYELRRKGLIDGLTLTDEEGRFIVTEQERAACATALAPAADNGTALALLAALQIEPDPRVRAAIVETMGAQRLLGYREFLDKLVGEEKDANVLEVAKWAIAEIERDGVETRPGVAPELLDGAAPDAKPAEPGDETPSAG